MGRAKITGAYAHENLTQRTNRNRKNSMIPDIHQRIETEWNRCFETLVQGEFFRRLAQGHLTRNHYAALLAEEYHNTTVNPKTMALFIARLDIDYHRSAAKMLKHAAQEMGHNEMALNDLARLGGDPEAARKSRPLPTTEALTAFVIYATEHSNPLTFLGYLYHMEALSLRLADSSGDVFAKMGIPEDALTFLREHADADPAHMNWNREYLQDFIVTEADLEAVLHGMRTCCMLHGLMFQGVLDSVDKRGYFAEPAWVPGNASGILAT